MTRREHRPGRPGPGAERRPLFPASRWLFALLFAVALALAVGSPLGVSLTHVVAARSQAQPTPDPANQQSETTPEVPSDPTAPQSADEPAPTEAPAQEQPQENRQAAAGDPGAATEPGAPAVLAHGLAYVDGGELVWQVRETDMPDEPEGITTDEAVMLQRDGSTIVRNDVTAKRAKLDPGEAYFLAADDPYTVVSDTVGSLVWIFGLVSPDNVDDDAFYESPLIEDLDEGVYDMSLVRYVLQPGGTADLPEHTGPALVMVSDGEIEVEDESGLSTLASGDGQLMPGEATITNRGSGPAVYLVAMLGDQVSDETAAAPQDTTGEETAAEEPAADEGATYVTSIDVSADADIYLTVTADGVTVFDGTLPAGSSTGPIVGSVFDVYTSSGINTYFTNACGVTFQMGYEEGEATYTLAADETSCAP